ncbi:MAG: GHKL domain-containing protein [Lachnospiraceae bacterium]|nr:GHKL domain-containing protein [Lachnospiraceae bacterium]
MKLAAVVCLVSVAALVFYRAAGKAGIFLTVVFLAVGEISVFLAYTAGQIGRALIPLWGRFMERGYIVSGDALSILIHATVVGTAVLEFLTVFVFQYYPLKCVAGFFREKDFCIGGMELLFLTVPGLTGLLICSLLRTILLTMEDGAQKQIYDKYPPLVIIVPLILLLSLVSIVFGVKLFQDMACWNREKSSRIILEKQVSSLQEHMGEMERVYSGVRGMKHDMRNTLSVIMQFASEGEGREGELQAYLEELNQAFDRLEIQFKTGNAVADTVLNMKCHEAARAVPDLRMDAEGLQFPEKMWIQSYDIGIILGNALDNAMEACRKLKAGEPEAEAFIRISSFQKRGLFFLKVENSFDGRLALKRQETFPITDKADKKSHGIGLANIKSTAEKYQGTMDFKVKGRVFILSVMMKNEG